MPHQHSVVAFDRLEPRTLLSATVLGDIPDVRFSNTGDSTEIELSQFFDDPAVTGSTVKIDTPLGAFYVETYDTITPITAGNFLDLVAGGNYDDMFFHRSVPGFVLQGGGFTFPATSNTTRGVANNGTIVNEFDNWFDPDLGGLSAGDPVNLRGTIAMAKQGGNPDSATSQWFVSVDDNQSILDPQNGGFTVFAHVLFDGMDVVDQLMALDIVNAGSGTAFETLPVIDLDPNATSVGRANLLLTTSTIVDELQYATTTSDLVSAEIVDGKLKLTATESATSQTESVQITVTATDLQGTSATSVVTVALPSIVVTGPADGISSTPTITWSGVPEADSYDLRINKLDDRFTSVVAVENIFSRDGISGTSLTVSEALPDGQYHVSVRSRNASGPGAWSEDFLFYAGLEVPGRVAAPAVTPSAANELDVSIQWDSVSDATHYDIWISEVGGEALVRENWIFGTSFTPDFTLTAGTTYRAWVRGRNAAEVASWSPVTQFVGGTAKPDRITIETPASGVVNSVAPAISWTADPVATDYEVWIAGSGSTAAVRTTTTDTIFTTAETLADGFYRAWVRAKNGNGFGPWSRAISFGVAQSSARATITGPTGNPIPSRPEITWTTGIPGGTYQLWVNQVGGQSAIINESGIASASFTPSSDLADGGYVAWIRQVPPSGSAFPWSTAFRFEVGASTAPARPTLNVGANGGAVTYSWEALPNAARYELWVNDDSGRVLHDTQLTSLEHITTSLQAGGTYRAWLRAFSTTGVSGKWSSVASISI